MSLTPEDCTVLTAEAIWASVRFDGGIPEVKGWSLWRTHLLSSNNCFVLTLAPAGETTVAIERVTPMPPVIRSVAGDTASEASVTNSLPGTHIR